MHGVTKTGLDLQHLPCPFFQVILAFLIASWRLFRPYLRFVSITWEIQGFILLTTNIKCGAWNIALMAICRLIIWSSCWICVLDADTGSCGTSRRLGRTSSSDSDEESTFPRKSGGGITSQSEGFRLLPGFRAALCRARCVARAQDRAESADGRWVSRAEVDWACACWLVPCYLNQVPHCRSLRTPSLHPHHASPTRGTHLAEQYRGGCRRFLDSYVIATVACMRQASFIPR